MSWSAWIPMGSPPGGFIGRPAMLSSNSRVTNIYVRGADNALWQLPCQEGRWLGWSRHDDGMVLTSAPAVGSMGPGQEILFAVGIDGMLWSKSWTTGKGWSGWTSLGAPGAGLLGSPAATRRDHPGCHAYVRGGDHALWQVSYRDDDRHEWRHLGGKLASDPGVASVGLGHEMVFAVGPGGDVRSKTWTQASGWRGWDSLGSPNGGATDGPCAVSRQPGVVHMYVGSADGALWQREYRDGVWHGWQHDDDAALVAGPAACSRGPDHELLVHHGRDARLYLKWWEPNLRTVDVNLIRVGIDHELTDRDAASSLDMARSICLQAGLNVGAVSQFRIGSRRSAALEVLDSLAEAEELSDRWAVPGSALDVFLVRSMNVAGGWLTVPGRGGAHSTDTGGDVPSRNGSLHSVGCPNRTTIVCDWSRGTLSSLRHNRSADQPPARDAEAFFLATLRDGSADATVRAAAATGLSRFATAQAEALLLAALDGEHSALVRHKIVAGLARLGGEDSLAALSELTRSDPTLASHAAFTQSVIAHRIGIGGYEPATAEESPLAPVPEGLPSSRLLGTYETIPAGSQLPGDTYGLIVGPGVAGLRCGDRRLIVAIDLTALARLLTTPTIAGLVATRATSDGSLHTSMLVLCWPAGDNTAHVAVHRPSGTPVFVGTAKIAGTSVSFRLTAVRTPGSCCGAITGTITSGLMTDLSVSSGPILPSLTPEPI